MNKPNMEEEIRKVEKLACLMALPCDGEENMRVVMACLNIIYHIMEASDTRVRTLFSAMLYDTANFPYEGVRKELQ